MKKLFALLLALMMILSLAACGGGNNDKPPDGGNDSPGTSQEEQDKSTKDNPAPEGSNAEFTIYVNGSEEWTPFSGKSGVTFIVADEDLISVSDNGAKISFTGKQVGETVITATLDGAKCEALVRVRAMEAAYVPARYVPLNDFLIEYTERYDENITLGVIGNEYVRFGYEPYPCHYVCGATSTKRYYDDGSGWQYDENWPEEDDGGGAGLIENTRKNAEDFYDEGSLIFGIAMFDNYFYSFSFTSPEQSIAESYVGTEVIADIECWVYECKNVQQGGTYKFWVNPDTGHCLKYLSDNNLEWEVKKINLELTEWPQEWGIK